MNLTTPELLLVATVAVPLVLLLACAVAPLRRLMPALAVLAPLPGLAAALTAVGVPPLASSPAGSRRSAVAWGRPSRPTWSRCTPCSA